MIATDAYDGPCTCQGSDGDEYGFTLDPATGVWVHARCLLPKKLMLDGLPTSMLGNTVEAPTKPAPAATEPLESPVTESALDAAVENEQQDGPTGPETFAEAEERLAAALPGYQPRVPQQNLAGLVESALWDRKHALAEAGTGTGKSLGSLIPAIIWATSGGQRVVYSTATKALQEQIAGKDLPFLQEHLGIDFDWALLKGRSNYFCKAKALDADQRFTPVAQLQQELDADPTHSGDREHFGMPLTDAQWRGVASTSEECPGKRKCPFGEECYAEFAKGRAKAADVVVVNHALTFTDVKVKEVTNGWASMLGEVDAYIFDEAHEIEEIATSMMTDTLRRTGIAKLATEAINFADDWGVKDSHQIGGEVNGLVGRVWGCLPVIDERKPESIRLNLPWFIENGEPFMDLMDALYKMADAIGGINVHGVKPESTRARLVERAMNYAATIARIATEDDLVLVRWVEQDDKQNVLLRSAPLRVGPWLDKNVWSKAPSILVSATLSVGGDFTFIQDRLGIEDAKTLNVGTPFDFPSQALLYIPPGNMPSPKDQVAWRTMTPILTEEILTASGGGGLLLYTSRAAMKAAFETLAPRLEAKGIRCLMQGEHGTNKELAKIFTEDEHSCLFAMKSFFTGVDFQGNTCRAVIIDKLPFPVPTDVMFAARSAEVERNGGSSFTGMSVPMMTLTLLQGFGRLIRSTEDRGIVAILDSRLSSASWGRKIADNMPDATRTTDMDAVRRFFAV